MLSGRARGHSWVGAVVLLLVVTVACGDDADPQLRAESSSPGGVPADYTFDNFDYPGAVSTTLFSIDEDGTIVGYYADASTVGDFGDTPVHAFVLPPGDEEEAVDFHAPRSDENTAALGFGPRGEIVGHYVDEKGVVHAYLRAPGGGDFEVLDHPGAIETHAFGFNDDGQVSGFYVDADGGVHGFVWTRDSERFAAFDHPGSKVKMTYGSSIDDSGRIVGHFVDDSGLHGYIRSPDGKEFTDFDHPEANGQTAALAINEVGMVVGFYVDNENVTHGYVLSADGESFNDIDHPKGVKGTFTFGMNDSGQIVGYYVDAAGINHGFVATPEA